MSASELSEDAHVTASSNQVSCDLAGEVAILNLANGVYYGLDAVGARIWALVQTPATFAQIRDAMLAEFDVDPAVLETDLRQLLSELAKQGLIDIQP